VRREPRDSITIEGREDKIIVVVDGEHRGRIRLSVNRPYLGRAQVLLIIIALVALIVQVIQVLQP